MTWRRMNITRDENIADAGGLSRHPNVRRYLHFPWGYTMFEFYDPIFESVYGVDPARHSEATRSRLATLMREERDLLGPVYKGRPDHWQGNQFGLLLKTAVYRVIDKKKLAWPWFGSSPAWEIKRRIKVEGRLKATTVGIRDSLGSAFGEWAEWATALGELERMAQIAYDDKKFSVLCDFSNACGDVCVALYLLLTKTRRQTSLEAVGFFNPEESSSTFLEIGGTGVVT
jgi:hypothetical protein